MKERKETECVRRETISFNSFYSFKSPRRQNNFTVNLSNPLLCKGKVGLILYSFCTDPQHKLTFTHIYYFTKLELYPSKTARLRTDFRRKARAVNNTSTLTQGFIPCVSGLIPCQIVMPIFSRYFWYQFTVLLDKCCWEVWSWEREREKQRK